MQEIVLSVSGMSCGHCVKAVQNALEQIAGVSSHEVTIGEAKVRYEGSKVNVDDIRRAIEEEGYSVEN